MAGCLGEADVPRDDGGVYLAREVALDLLRYLKGETISLEVDEGPVRGWCLAAMEGFPLGWAKGTGMSLKNKYYPGWRWQ